MLLKVADAKHRLLERFRIVRANAAKLQPDDLILFVNNAVVASYASVVETLSLIDHIDPVRLTVQRGQQLVDVVLEAKE